MLLRENSDSNISYIKQAMHENKKYKEIYSRKEELHYAIKGFVERSKISDDLLNLPFYIFIAPLGIGAFSKANSYINNNPCIKEIIDYINDEISTDEMHKFEFIKKIPNFKSQALGSLSFHNYVYQKSFQIQERKDTLDYIFKIDESIEMIKLWFGALEKLI